MNEFPHRRYNPLTESWVLVSPHRSSRPWQGQVEKTQAPHREAYDPTCYLCPGNTRAGGIQTPDYSDVYVFDNDFSALLPDQPDSLASPQPESKFFRSNPERGLARVICFSPRHDLTMAEMDTPSIRKVVDAWIEQYQELGSMDFINYVQIFENKGAIMGCSNPHPHGQIWAQESIPDEPLKKQNAQLKYWNTHKTTLLSDYLADELAQKTRILFENEGFVALIPFWAVWPFEAMIIPKRPMASISALSEPEKTDLADAYRRLAVMYDQLFQTSFPYSAGIHQAPTDGLPHEEWHFHLVFYPPLLRSATVKKFMVGYEMLANPQRDITPERAAEMLKAANI